ncbi:uncharacterized protein J3D65DRAFT_132442 [Phyllosticta citribraziliensis]|uniref:Uncharacterized protein n=1 Tax=Phyllosticta citribraziliensis TaxID=989973 RepID=A0ABR1L612_9PEZI
MHPPASRTHPAQTTQVYPTNLSAQRNATHCPLLPLIGSDQGPGCVLASDFSSVLGQGGRHPWTGWNAGRGNRTSSSIIANKAHARRVSSRCGLIGFRGTAMCPFLAIFCYVLIYPCVAFDASAADAASALLNRTQIRLGLWAAGVFVVVSNTALPRSLSGSKIGLLFYLSTSLLVFLFQSTFIFTLFAATTQRSRCRCDLQAPHLQGARSASARLQVQPSDAFSRHAADGNRD